MPGRGELLEVRLAECLPLAGVASRRAEQRAETLAGQVFGTDLSAAIARPELEVDLAVAGEQGERVRNAETPERPAEGCPLGAIRVEEGVVGVQEDGAERGQEGRSYFAR